MTAAGKKTWRIAVAAIIVVAVIMVAGTIQTGRRAKADMTEAVRSVSSLYLGELAGRREQVVEDNLQQNITTITVAVGMISDEDLQDLEHMWAYQRQIKKLFSLDRFAFVDEKGNDYTADEGVLRDMEKCDFDYLTFNEPKIFIKDPKASDKKIIIAEPIRDKDLSIEGNRLVACYMEIDMDVLLKGVSMSSQKTDVTFCNIYTSQGVPLTNAVLGGLAEEDNLLDALEHADYMGKHSAERIRRDFREGRSGKVTFDYNGIEETLSYVPITGTDWFLTYLIRESVISDQISGVSSSVIRRSLIQSILMALVLALMFAYILYQMRKTQNLELEKETAEAINRAKNEEMQQRLDLQEELLAQKAQQDEQARMITALSSDYRSVYYLELDKNLGICYQSRSDIEGFKVGENFPYLEAVTAYANQYVKEQYREEFLQFIQPDAIREGLKDSLVISYRYMIEIDGKDSYEAVHFAGVRHPEDRDDHIVHTVGACFVDIDDEMRKEMAQQQTLTEALTAAEQASKAKTAFLSNMSHEIRTPMNAIIGLNSIALKEPDLPDKIREYLEKTSDSAQHLLEIINDVLDMSRIESGRMIIKDEEFSFAKNLEQVNTIISGQCADKGIEYECHTAGKIDDYYVGDGMKLKQVLINILGNAVKFTPEGGKVTFRIEEGRRYKGQATVKMTIQDTGIGMSKEYLPHLFDPFSQEDSSSTNRYGSTGLGMPITKSIIELMNGSISVESEKGAGTTFTVTVPLGEADHRRREAVEAQFNPKEMSVLVIDDDEIALKHARFVLDEVGITCETAMSGAEGIEKVTLRHGRREDYDLILVDWKMPEIDGVETTRKIREIVGYDAPVIILTSYNWDEVADEAREAGVDSFVPKPLFAGSVLDEFKEVFAQKYRANAEARVDLKGRHILLAEDVPVNAEIMVMVLSMRDMEVDVAENGKEAVDKYEEHPAGYYDAILMDMRMPVMDGLEATVVIRASDHEDAKTIPIIALTANAFDEDVQRSLQAGLNAHLSKPVDPEALYETLENMIKP